MRIKATVMRGVLAATATAAILAAGVAGYWWNKEPAFDAERILAQSKLKGRTFQGEVREVRALGGKVGAYLMEEHSVPLAAVSLRFAKAGTAYETKPGVALLAESVLLDGAGDYSRKELRRLMKEKGIRLDAAADNDTLAFSLSYVKEFENEALEVLRAVLFEPQLNEEDLALARRQLAVLRQREKESPAHQLGELVKREFYGSHPYGRASIPDEAALEAVTAADIRAYLQTVTGKDNLTIGIAGDMDRAEAEAFLSRAFADLPDKAQVKALPEFKPDFQREKIAEVSPISAQSIVLTAAAGVARLDKDFYPLYVADYIFGGAGLSSRLSQAVREKEGLTYGIYSMLSMSDAVNTWSVGFSATPENTAEIMKIAAAEYRDFYDNGVSEEELQQAKNSLMASFNLRFGSLINIAGMLEQMQYQKLGRDFLQNRQAQVAAITADEVNSAIKRRLPKSFDAAGGVRVFEVSGGLKAARENSAAE